MAIHTMICESLGEAGCTDTRRPVASVASSATTTFTCHHITTTTNSITSNDILCSHTLSPSCSPRLRANKASISMRADGVADADDAIWRVALAAGARFEEDRPDHATYA